MVRAKPRRLSSVQIMKLGNELQNWFVREGAGCRRLNHQTDVWLAGHLTESLGFEINPNNLRFLREEIFGSVLHQTGDRDALLLQVLDELRSLRQDVEKLKNGKTNFEKKVME